MHTESKPGMAVVVDGSVLRETFDIKGRLKRNPYGMVAGALGIGFALGGGIFTRLASRILGSGLRIGLMAALPIVQKQIIEALTKPKSDTTKGTDQ
jgi:uncharacterized membrane protein YhaH (DUF805 family)